MTESQSRGVWGSGAAYEPYVGRWSRLLAREFLTWLAISPSARWLDVGCGTGALSQTILAQASPEGCVGSTLRKAIWLWRGNKCAIRVSVLRELMLGSCP
jgi:GNAT superfamily N-acetyltransferase